MRISDWSSDGCSSDLTLLGLRPAHRMREMRREGLARIARRRDRRLLDIDALAVDVRRRQHQRRGRTHRGDDPAHLAVRAGFDGLGQLVPAELEHLVARDLRVIGREVRSEEHRYELQSIMRILYDVFRLKKKNNK